VSEPVQIGPDAVSKAKERCRYCERIIDKLYEARKNFYGWYVCSRPCDIKSCVAMESSMPGAGPASRPGCQSQQQIDDNWAEEDG
jgi:hypothetical protein